MQRNDGWFKTLTGIFQYCMQEYFSDSQLINHLSRHTENCFTGQKRERNRLHSDYICSLWAHRRSWGLLEDLQYLASPAVR